MKDELVAVIVEALTEIAEDTGRELPGELGAETRLYGQGGLLDSQGMVLLTIAVEEKIADRFGKDVVLTDERAMSRAVSPFAQVRRLAAFAQERLEEDG